MLYKHEKHFLNRIDGVFSGSSFLIFSAMKRTASICFLFSSLTVFSQDWTWINGTDSINKLGNYGVKNTEAPTNKPGSRHVSLTANTSTYLYLFGGSGYASTTTFGQLNDLWQYNLANNQWTWIQGSNVANEPGIYGTLGVEGATARPGGRGGGGAFTDAANNLWIFGGMGYTESTYGLCNDVWRYNPTTDRWTWIKGSKTANQTAVYGTKGIAAAGNRPGARYEFSSTTDAAGNFWVFGGSGMSSVGSGIGSAAPLNDLWRYNPSTNQWTWVSGDNNTGMPSVYGTKGIPSTANRPGARLSANCWFDANGNFWLFGGAGTDVSNAVAGPLNELWRFNPSTNEWTWMGGLNTINTPGIYGTQGTASNLAMPGARTRSNGFKDAAGNFWIFSGFGYGELASPKDYLNDVWKFDPLTLQWTWVKGSKQASAAADFGTLNVTAPTNTPGGRQSGVSWFTAGNFYLFGGSGYDRAGWLGHLNDLWKLTVHKGVYIFTGNGDWNTDSNWQGALKPPATVPSGYLVLIDHAAGAECVLTSTVTIAKGAQLIVQPGKKLRVAGHLIQE